MAVQISSVNDRKPNDIRRNQLRGMQPRGREQCAGDSANQAKKLPAIWRRRNLHDQRFLTRP